MNDEFDPEQITWLKDMQRVQLKPDDILFVWLKDPMPERAIAYVKETFTRHFPDNQVIVLCGDIEVGVIEVK